LKNEQHLNIDEFFDERMHATREKGSFSFRKHFFLHFSLKNSNFLKIIIPGANVIKHYRRKLPWQF
jgi:hypothetical protein